MMVKMMYSNQKYFLEKFFFKLSCTILAMRLLLFLNNINYDKIDRLNVIFTGFKDLVSKETVCCVGGKVKH